MSCPRSIRFLFSLLLPAFFSASSLAQANSSFIEMGSLPEHITRPSGMAVASENSFWLIDQDDSEAAVYEVDLRGELLRTVRLEGVAKVSFADLAQDDEGHLYVGDMGNPDKERQKMLIYILDLQRIKVDLERSTDEKKVFKIAPDRIEYVLPFEAMQSDCHYDVESMVWNNGELMLFTRDRCQKKDNQLYFYSLPAAEGIYTAQSEGYFNWEDEENNITITGADLSTDGKSLALLSPEAIHLFYGYKKDRYFAGTYRYLPTDAADKLALSHLDSCNLYYVEAASEDGPGRILKVNLCNIEMD